MPNFYHHIHRTLLQQAEQVLLVWPGGATAGLATAYTGRDLGQRIAAYQQLLRKHNTRAGQPVLLGLPVGAELICGLLAVMSLGAVPVLPPAGASAVGVLGLLRRNGVGAALVPNKSARRYNWLLRGLGVRLLGAPQHLGTAELLPPQAVPATQPALVSHSSGSTGQAKAIRRSHAVLTAQHEVLKQVFPPWPGQRDFPLFPNVLLHNLAVGALSVLPDVPWGQLANLQPARLVQQLQTTQAETLTGNVFYFAALCGYLEQHHPTPLPHVRALGVGGSPVPESLLQRLRSCFAGAAVYVIYGSSEAEPIAVRLAEAPTNPRSGYCVGPVQAGLSCRLQPLGVVELPNGTQHQVGEVCVQGAHVAAEPGTWLHTGDFGYLDAQGLLWLTGRKGNEAICQGVQHYQVEHVLCSLPGMERAAARATPTGFDVYYQGTVSDAAVRTALAQHFPVGLCNRILRRQHLPVDSRHLSKILYHQLR
ncbi:AMP-binding protein [Hymenobacter oligotrophus]|uniref:AMP-binding protein n=1 Tax=Hymenobacter oligotrophus TaxID=2319843 RepID=UPI0013C2DB92|nr:AMP-binding protein [Hymenobacter oligotrophus]